MMEMFVLSYVNVLCIYAKLCLQVGLVPSNGSEPTWQTSMLYSDIVPLIYVNESIYMVICPSTRFKSMILLPGMTHWCQDYPKICLMDEGPGAILNFKTFFSFINRLLVTV